MRSDSHRLECTSWTECTAEGPPGPTCSVCRVLPFYDRVTFVGTPTRRESVAYSLSTMYADDHAHRHWPWTLKRAPSAQCLPPRAPDSSASRCRCRSERESCESPWPYCVGTWLTGPCSWESSLPRPTLCGPLVVESTMDQRQGHTLPLPAR